MKINNTKEDKTQEKKKEKKALSKYVVNLGVKAKKSPLAQYFHMNFLVNWGIF